MINFLRKKINDIKDDENKQKYGFYNNKGFGTLKNTLEGF